jgi:hypothetical protein
MTDQPATVLGFIHDGEITQYTFDGIALLLGIHPDTITHDSFNNPETWPDEIKQQLFDRLEEAATQTGRNDRYHALAYWARKEHGYAIYTHLDGQIDMGPTAPDGRAVTGS